MVIFTALSGTEAINAMQTAALVAMVAKPLGQGWCAHERKEVAEREEGRKWQRGRKEMAERRK